MLGVFSSALTDAAIAAPPVFPDNIVVFPNRDFVSFSGFQDHIGEQGLVKVTRPGVGVVGSVSVVVGEGDPAFEVNHPGGYCWGAGTSLKVTPDILPGDVVSFELAGGGEVPDVHTQDAYATAVNYVDGAATFTVTGHIGAGIDPANLEQRTVNPAMRDTAIGRRDIRAVSGPLAADTSGTYQSSLVVAGNTFTATYVFLDPAVARIAATGGGERLMTWETVDLAGNRQGITIAELGELGGPGLGGCPSGPVLTGPQGPSNVTAVNVPAGIKVDWTPAVALPGTEAITGYRVVAVAQTVSPSGEQVEIGRRITGRTVSTTTLTGLASGELYDVYVVSVSAAGETFPAVHIAPVTDITPPVVSAAPPGGLYANTQLVTLSANEAGSQIYYTIDGTDPLIGADVLDPAAIAYNPATPLSIAATSTLKAVAFDLAGNVSDPLIQTYTIDGTILVPGKVTITSAIVGTNSVDLTWTIEPGFVVTDYEIRVLDVDNNLVPVDVVPVNPIIADNNDYTVTGLTEGIPYYFTVTAINDNGSGPASDRVGPRVPLGSIVANAGPDKLVTRGLTPTTVTLTGAGSTVQAGVTYQWTQVQPFVAADAAVITGATTLSPTFSLPLYLYPATNTARTFRLTVTDTGSGTVRTDDVKVTPVAGDTAAVTRAVWKTGDFRIDGTSTVNGSVIRVHTGSLNGPVIGIAPATATNLWSLRLRNAAAGPSRPASLWIESTLGGTAGPFTNIG